MLWIVQSGQQLRIHHVQASIPFNERIIEDWQSMLLPLLRGRTGIVTQNTESTLS